MHLGKIAIGAIVIVGIATVASAEMAEPPPVQTSTTSPTVVSPQPDPAGDEGEGMCSAPPAAVSAPEPASAMSKKPTLLARPLPIKPQAR
jgi:hypothetical protein